MPKQSCLTQDLVRDLLDYDPETGIFRWRPRNPDVKGWNKRMAGTVAGTISFYGYVMINVERTPRCAHRLAWLMMTGSMPLLVDHIDGDKANNRWRNLRVANKSLNAANSKVRTDNTSGSKGVSWDSARERWSAYINCEGYRFFLGRFATREEAAAAYAAAADKAFGDFARLA